MTLSQSSLSLVASLTASPPASRTGGVGGSVREGDGVGAFLLVSDVASVPDDLFPDAEMLFGAEFVLGFEDA